MPFTANPLAPLRNALYMLRQRDGDPTSGSEGLTGLTGRERRRQLGQDASGPVRRVRQQHDVRGQDENSLQRDGQAQLAPTEYEPLIGI